MHLSHERVSATLRVAETRFIDRLNLREFDSLILRALCARKIGLLRVLRDAQHPQKPDRRIHVKLDQLLIHGH